MLCSLSSNTKASSQFLLAASFKIFLIKLVDITYLKTFPRSYLDRHILTSVTCLATKIAAIDLIDITKLIFGRFIGICCSNNFSDILSV